MFCPLPTYKPDHGVLHPGPVFRPVLETVLARACACAVGVLVVDALLHPLPVAAQPAAEATASSPSISMPAPVQTRDLAARFQPFPPEARQALLKTFPGGRGDASHLADSFEGDWYVHEGDLIVDSGFRNNLNLVVRGNLIVRGVLSDLDDSSSLVVTGDVLAHHILSRQLLVVLGSLRCSGLVHADYNDWSFEVWGPVFESRAYIITDRSTMHPDDLKVEYLYNADSATGKGTAEKVLHESLVRWQDEEGDQYRREMQKGKVQWLDEEGTPLETAAAKKLKITGSLPAGIEEIAAVCDTGRPPFITPVLKHQDWRLDPTTDAGVVADHAAAKDVSERTAAAGHSRLPQEWVVRLAADPAPEVRRVVVHHPELPAKEAAALAADQEASVRQQVAASRHAAALLEGLVADPETNVRRACASHPALTDDQRRRLLHDPEKRVRLRAVRYLPVTAAWVKELRNAKEEELVAWAVQHEGDEVVSSDPSVAMNAGDWKKDLADERPAVRVAALGKAPRGELFPYLQEQQSQFAKDPSADVRRALAMASRDAATLEVLGKDADKYVRRFALDNLSAPPALLIQEAHRLAAAPEDSWNLTSDKYIEHSSELHDLLNHPRLPEEAVRIIAKVYPRLWRMEPRRNMPLDVILERAVIDSADVELAPGFEKWKQAAAKPGSDVGPVLAAFLETDSDYLKSCARMHGQTPVKALLKHARSLEGDKYSLEEVAKSPRLGSDSPEAEELRQYLLKLPEGAADRALSGNPDLPAQVLKELAKRGADDANLTLWQAHGVVIKD